MTIRISLLLLLSSLFLFQCNGLRSLTEPTERPSVTESGTEASVLRQDMVNFALEQTGVPYQYGGRSPRTGFDCSGLTHYVFDRFDLELTPVSRVQETEGQKIKISQAQPGDLVFFRRSALGNVFHVALVVENGSDGLYVVHSTSSRGVIRQKITGNSYWQPKLSSARRYF